MKHLTIQFDIDGVLADFVLGYTQLASGLFPMAGIRVFGTREQPSWHFSGITKAQDSAIWGHIIGDPNWWNRLTSLATIEEFGRLITLNENHNVYFATSRPGYRTREQSIWWLEDRGIRRPQVIVTSLKGEIAQATGADYSIDDKAGNAIAVSYMAPRCKSYILDQPYNRFDHSIVGGSVKRVQTVGEFLEEVSRG